MYPKCSYYVVAHALPQQKDPCAEKMRIAREAIANIKADGNYDHVLSAISSANPAIVIASSYEIRKEHKVTGQIITEVKAGNGAAYNSTTSTITLTVGGINSSNGKFESQIVHEGTHVYDKSNGMDMKRDWLDTEVNAWTNTFLYAESHGGVANHYSWAMKPGSEILRPDGTVNEPRLRSSLNNSTGQKVSEWKKTITPSDPCATTYGEISQ
jgi:hypothetical protein